MGVGLVGMCVSLALGCDLSVDHMSVPGETQGALLSALTFP